MSHRICGGLARRRRRGAVAVQVVVLLGVLLGMAALTFDVGAMYNTRGDMQRSVDAAALAAASMLAQNDAGDPLQLARATAEEYVAQNPVFGRTLVLAQQDVEFGQGVYNAALKRYDFTPTQVASDCIRVRLRMTPDSPNGAMPLYFACVLGKQTTSVSAEAIAMLIPRDIAVVSDLSSSLTDDSELKHVNLTQINLFDVWGGLPIAKGNAGVGNGLDPPPPGNPNNENDQPGTGPGNPANAGGNPNPGAEPFTDDMPHGPRWGWMTGYGSEIVFDETTNTNLYDPTTDIGLYYIPKGVNTTNADVIQNLTQSGYTAQEQAALLSSANDGNATYYTNRVKVLLGLAGWKSKMKDALGNRNSKYNGGPGNGDGAVNTNEITQEVSFPYSTGSWSDYISYVRGNTSAMVDETDSWGDADLRYRYGIKTVVNYALENKSLHTDGPDLANCPVQPFQSIKDAVQEMTTLLADLDTDDQVSLEAYDMYGRHEVNLTPVFADVSTRMNELQGGHYAAYTNIGDGINEAIYTLTNNASKGRPDNARDISRKFIFLLTDGLANVNASHQASTTSATILAQARTHATDRATAAAALGIRIYTVTVGAEADQALMAQIAQIGNGSHFHAQGSTAEYSEQLRQIFISLGGTRPVELIK